MLLSAVGSMRFWLYTAPADMRKGFDGLAGLVRNGLGDDPLRGDVFVFISRSRVQIKLLYWDGDGYVLFSKRLERGRFDMPAATGASRSLRRDELLMLLEGVRLVDTKRKDRYSRS
jgi:transposase